MTVLDKRFTYVVEKICYKILSKINASFEGQGNN